MSEWIAVPPNDETIIKMLDELNREMLRIITAYAGIPPVLYGTMVDAGSEFTVEQLRTAMGRSEQG